MTPEKIQFFDAIRALINAYEHASPAIREKPQVMWLQDGIGFRFPNQDVTIRTWCVPKEQDCEKFTEWQVTVTRQIEPCIFESKNCKTLADFSDAILEATNFAAIAFKAHDKSKKSAARSH